MKAVLTRRNGLLGAGAATLAGGAWIVTAKAADLLIPFFQENLPGVTLDLPSTRLAIEDYLSATMTTAEERIAVAVWRVFGVQAARKFHDKFETLTRNTFSYFLLNSNFFTEASPTAPDRLCASSPRRGVHQPVRQFIASQRSSLQPIGRERRGSFWWLAPPENLGIAFELQMRLRPDDRAGFAPRVRR